MSEPTQEEVCAAAEAIANTRAGRAGAPPIANVLEFLSYSHPKLYTEVFEDATAALKAAAQVRK